MRTIGEIRRLRLQQFAREAGESFAEMNVRMGRSRRDATLSQYSRAAPNTTTGSPREMGSSTARQIERTYLLPHGWFDVDPDTKPDRVMRRADGTIYVTTVTDPAAPAAHAVQQVQRQYETWPFKMVSQADVAALAPSSRETLERMILAFLGNPVVPPDWRSIALTLAAQIDKGKKKEDFTTFVRAIEFELSRRDSRAVTASGAQ